MPQMSPMMWFSLFIMFSITMIMFNQMNFFSYMPNKNKKTSYLMKKSKINWKW
uniref:ATP synthase complex subunit 8 n=1 Tax=Heteropternis respondens TaxID=290721 RepID=A0A6G6A5P2_9ORTH|nr:ATP synthase F0 subunit 8 [Heteropternis respondens]QID03606.1 ATP synthase F0 subunit 8 [Heteropternis respondens]